MPHGGHLSRTALVDPMPGYWLMKSEPDVFSIDDLKRKKREVWDGVRNYQARNYMRDGMKVGDLALFYHSSCADPGVAGIVRVSAPAHPDATQFDPKSDYFDPKSTRETPRWLNVDVTLVERNRRVVRFTSLGERIADKARRVLREAEELGDMVRAAGKPLSGDLRMSVIPTIAPFLLPRILPRLRRDWPDLKLYLREETSGAACESLNHGRADCCLLYTSDAADE